MKLADLKAFLSIARSMSGAPKLPALRHIHIADGRMTCTDTSVEVSAPCDIDGAGLLPVTTTSKLLTGSGKQQVQVSWDVGDAVVEVSGRQARLTTLPLGEYPALMQAPEGPAVVLPELLDDLATVAHAVSRRGDGRTMLEAVRFGDGYVCTTDGYRLAMVTRPSYEGLDAVLPSSVLKAAKALRGPIAWRTAPGIVGLEDAQGTRVLCRQRTEQYPDVLRVLPAREPGGRDVGYDRRGMVDVAVALAACKACAPLVGKSHFVLLESGTMTVTCWESGVTLICAAHA